jgi:hypothetical protein
MLILQINSAEEQKMTYKKLILPGLLVLGLCACTSTSAESTASAASTAAAAASSATASTTTTTSSSNTSAITIESSSNGVLDATTLFSERDLEQSVDTTTAETITVSDGQDVTISQEGTYILTGTASDVTITIDATDSEKIQLVLDDLQVTNTDQPVIYAVTADKLFINLASGSDNVLSVTGTFTTMNDDNTDAVIYSKCDLTLNGTGSLTISSTCNGISAKDDLVITGGTYTITSTEDAIEAHNSISIADGTFSITAGKDAFHSEDSDDDSLGSIYVCGGTFDITAGDDGLQATTYAQYDGGTFNIDAVEGLEATVVQINDGTFVISASDDGINASTKSSTISTPAIEINGGDITITMGSGDTDAIDSNGSLTINGGTLNITASSAFDYITSGAINGGSVTVNGQTVTTMTNSMNGGGGGGMQQGGNGNMGPGGRMN